MGVFAVYAPAYTARGFRVFPAGGEDGKRPLIRNWPKVGKRAAVALAEKFPDANLGVIDGDLVTRVDVDDQTLIDAAMRRFGDTPVKVRTPRGGLHLWYRANGERRIIGLDGARIDVLGKGGFGCAPPSVRPQGGCYSFLEGGLDDVDRLPVIIPGALPAAVDTPGVVGEGCRNKVLFARCLRDLAEGYDAELIPARAMVWNETTCSPPLGEAEVLKVAASAVKYHADGKNWIGSEGVLQITKSEFEAFAGDADALLLYGVLQLAHGSRNEPFLIVSRAMAAQEVIPGWGHNRYEAAAKRLMAKAKIALVKQGGGRGNPSLYDFT